MKGTNKSTGQAEFILLGMEMIVYVKKNHIWHHSTSTLTSIYSNTIT